MEKRNKCNDAVIMIPDKIFKDLVHTCRGYKMHSNGSPVEAGYQPDYVLKKANDYIILECENSSSRKTFVGGLIKAAHFLRGDNTGILIFVLVKRKNVTATAIANHLTTYLNWIKDKTNLREVYVIETTEYYQNDITLKIKSKQFLRLALKV